MGFFNDKKQKTHENDKTKLALISPGTMWMWTIFNFFGMTFDLIWLKVINQKHDDVV